MIHELSRAFPGEWREKEGYQYFLPGSIFLARSLTFDNAVMRRLERATNQLGRLSAMTSAMPDASLFISTYSRKEAVQSTRIEGTQASIEEAFQEDEKAIAAERRGDWHELQQYILAFDKAMEQLDRSPISLNLIKEVHKTLLSHGRGRHKHPGEFRASQNWLGGQGPSSARFVPPAPEYVMPAMDNLERFIHEEEQMPHLIKIALIHAQFETIHPFLDGNGRMGRMLIPLYLMANKLLERPVLYISDFFERNRDDYYDNLDNYRKNIKGTARWVAFFLDGIAEAAEQGVKSAGKITSLKEALDDKIIELGRRRGRSARKLVVLLFQKPVVNSRTIRRELGITATAVQQLLTVFVELGILVEKTGQKRNRIFVFEDYLDILE